MLLCALFQATTLTTQPRTPPKRLFRLTYVNIHVSLINIELRGFWSRMFVYYWRFLRNITLFLYDYSGIIQVVSRNCPTSPFFKLKEKWFYIGYIERLYRKKDYQFSSKLWKKVKTSPGFRFVGISLNINWLHINRK